jgi:hypothetical protein
MNDYVRFVPAHLVLIMAKRAMTSQKVPQF